MAHYKNRDPNQIEFIEINYKEQLIPGTFEHTINYLIDNKIDMSAFESRYKNDETGAPAWDPKTLLKIILYAYSKGIIWSRRIEDLCRTNIIMKALTADSVPHFTVIADFVSSMKDEIKSVFSQVIIICADLGLIGKTMFAVDGCKLPSNASKEWSGTFKDLKKKQKKLETLAELLIEKNKENDKKIPSHNSNDDLDRHLSNINKKADKISTFLKDSEPKIGPRGKEVQSNITDNESAKIKSSNGVIQGYNGIAVADDKNQVIIAAEAFGRGQEQRFFEPILEQTEENLKSITGKKKPLKKTTILADTGYFCEENLKAADVKKMEAIIPDNHFRQRMESNNERGRYIGKEYKFTQADFTYHKKGNFYICPNGKKLSFIGHHKLIGNSGNKYQSKIADCRDCPFREKCFKRNVENAKRRTLYIVDSKGKRNYSEEMRKKIDKPEFRDLYSKRMGIIEPVFANITSCKRMNRFTLRGKDKVNIQWLLFCIVHNMGKIQKALQTI
ncbi:MAG: IS1182 family transposase [Candidatus Dadabacteria bacterium]|nr:IS1182 family transposase [Nitrosopumilaceae archaeon]NIS08343.1 IS1182 family transposase [Candidatus Dadabacteria bacterium]NIU02141.1 IS1182 family transposase [Nitrosopumilaceae archaeon]NIV66766.1 IS1182 family transposase [Nitrosopumilaceae archaeon]NIX15220.1 IS1182 family transposase [Candidatus Dadabacteria bacterium]